MGEKRTILEQELREINGRIDELERRIPPHSVQPHLIAELDDLETTRDRILEDLERIGKQD